MTKRQKLWIEIVSIVVGLLSAGAVAAGGFDDDDFEDDRETSRVEYGEDDD